MMDYEDYNKSFEEVIEIVEEEADNRLRSMRQQCVREFIENLHKRQREWDTTFRELLRKSQELDGNANIKQHQATTTLPENSSLFLEPSLFGGLTFADTTTTTIPQPTTKAAEIPPVIDLSKDGSTTTKPSQLNQQETTRVSFIETKQQLVTTTKSLSSQPKAGGDENVENNDDDDDNFNDPLFSNSNSIKEFIRIQELLAQNRNSLANFTTDPALKSFRNELNLFIRTQINSISNSDSQHLDTKTRQLTNLFIGQTVRFQDRAVDASRHPQGQIYSMDLAAQTFVTVGTRLVNSVPAIAKSMAIVINGIVNNNLPIFRDLVIGHLQERCPYLIPMHPKSRDFSDAITSTTSKLQQQQQNKDNIIKYKVACGYNYDPKTQGLESDEKYLARMRSMVLIYACVLIQGQLVQAWIWLASFVSLKPQPVISATILQAYLQEASRKLSSTYGRQYKKLLAFIKTHYIKMIEDVTPKSSDRQSLIKLKNLLSDDSHLFAAPSVGSIFGVVRLT